MCMTKSPCFDEKTRTDCPRRSLECRAGCPEWAEWLVIHAQEVEKVNKKKMAERDVEDFLINQPVRIKRNDHEKSATKKRRGIR